MKTVSSCSLLGGRGRLVLTALSLSLGLTALAQTDPWALTPELAGQAVFSDADVTLEGTTVIDSEGVAKTAVGLNKGHVVGNGAITLKGNSTIKGDATAGPGKLPTKSGSAAITGASGSLPGRRPWPLVDLLALGGVVRTANDNATIPKTSKGTSPLLGTGKTDFRMDGNEALSLPGGTYYFTSFSIGGSSSITLLGPVRILCTGNVTIDGGSSINGASTASPFNLKLWVSGSSVTLDGGSPVKAYLYVPGASAKVTLNGNSQLIGAAAATRFELNGGSRVTRAIDDTPLAVAWLCGNRFRIRSPRVLASSVTWEVVGTTEKGTLELPPAPTGAPYSESYLTTASRGTLRLVESGQVVASVSNPGTACPPLAVSLTESGAALANGAVFNRNATPVVAVSGGTPPVRSAVTLDGASFVSGTVVSAEGSHVLRVVATDGATPPVTADVSRAFRIDKTAPRAAVISPAPGALVPRGPTEVYGTVDEPATVTVNGIAATVSGGAFTARGVPLAEGSNTLAVKAVDLAGNVTQITATVVLDSLVPALVLTSPAAGLLTREATVVVSGTATDAHLRSVTVNGVPAALAGASFSASVPLAEGRNPVRVEARDAAGNVTALDRPVERDSVPPALRVEESGAEISSGKAYDRSLTVSVLVTDSHPDTLTVTLDGASFTSGTTVGAEGSHTLVATARDRAGNTAAKTVSFTIDRTPPLVAISAPPRGQLVLSLPRTLEGTCGDATRVTVNGAQVTPAAGRFSIASFPFPQGLLTVTVTATDAAGNSASDATTYTVDTELPVVSIASPVPGALLRGEPFFVTGTASDATLRTVTVGGVPAVLDPDGGFRAGPFARPDGTTTLTATASDAAGRTASASVTLTVDSTPPVISIARSGGGALTDGAHVNAAFAVVVTVTDATTPAGLTKSVRLDGAPYAGSLVSAEGAHRVDVDATDGAGNGATASVTFTLDTMAPAFADLAPPDGSVDRVAPVTVSGRVSADATSVTVGGQPASLSGGAFSRAGVALTEGRNAVPLAATDRAGNTGTTVLHLVLDTTPPTIAISAPSPGAVLGALTTTVTGSVSDPNLDAVTVEGGAAAESSGAFSRTGVALQEGPNTLTATARDRAGNTATATVPVTADTRPPALALTSPTPGTVLGASPVTVGGTVADPHLSTVTVNGVRATVSSDGRFSAAVTLTEGSNTLTARALDALGHEATAGVGVVLDTAAPVVTITSPADGARFRATPVTVTGNVDSAQNLAGVTVNGVPATLQGATFTATVPLVEGSNPVTARARKTTDKEGTTSCSVVLDTVAPRFLSSVPADGQTGVSLTPEIRLTFNEELAPATLLPAAFVLRAAPGAAVPVTATAAGPVVTLVPAAALSDSKTYTLTIAPSVSDLAGNPLPGTSLSFGTADETPPSRPALDPVPVVLCATALPLGGSAEPRAALTVTGGAAVAQGTADAAGRFSVSVPLTPGENQTLTVIARDAAGNASAPSTVSLTVDCQPPHVVAATRTAAAVTVTFDEAIGPASVVAGATTRLDRGNGSDPIAHAASLSADGLILTLAPTGIELTTLVFTLSLSSGVTDRAGNALVPFVRAFAPDAVAAVLVGEVYDDAIGRPISQGASATLLLSGGVATVEPRARASVTAAGSFSLPATSGDAVVQVSAPGYLDVYRRESAPAGVGVEAVSATVFDARLTPLAPPAARTALGSGTLFTAPASGRLAAATLSAPTGSLAADTGVRLTVRRPQGLPVLAPLGWSVASAASVSFTGPSGAPVSPSGAVALVLPDFFGVSTATPLTVARLDGPGLVWVAEGTATGVAATAASPGSVSFWIARAGDYAVLVPDPPPTAPPAPSLGAVLVGALLPADDPLQSATVTASPVDVLPSQTADVSLAVSSAAPVPSGYPVQCLVTEELTLLDGARVSAPSFLSDLVLQRRGDGAVGLAIPVRASEGAQRVALEVGYERFAVKKFPFEVRRGSVVGTSGGTASGPRGWSLSVPAGALPAATAISLTPVASTELPDTVPSDFDLVAAVRVSTGGVRLSLPGALSVQLAAAPPGGRDLLLAFFDDSSGLVLLRPVARASWSETTSRVSTLPVDRTSFPWPGVAGDGAYAFLAARSPLAYVSGGVFDVGGAPLASATVRVTSWPLVALTETAGAFALAVKAGPSTLSAVNPETGNAGALTVTPTPGQTITGVELRLAVTAPSVVSLSPTAGSTVLVSSRFIVTFSEALDPLSVTPESVTLAAQTPASTWTAIPGRVDLAPGSRTVALVPDTSLPSSTALRLTLSRALRDLTGYSLVDAATRQPADYVATFLTEDTSPPDSKPYLVTISLPAGDPPTVTVTGAPGSVCPGCHVVAFNDTTQATAATDAVSNGSFTLTLLARATDRIRVEVQKPNGTRQTLPPVPFTGDFGRTVLASASGGTWQTPEGYRITLPQGAVDAPTSIATTRLPRAQLDALVAPPRDMLYVDSFTLDLSRDGTPFSDFLNAGLDFSFAAPATSATDQFFIAQVVEVFGERRLMVVDLLTKQSGRLVGDDRGKALRAAAAAGLVTLVDSGGAPGSATGVTTLSVSPLGSVVPLDGFGGGQFDWPRSFWDRTIRTGRYALYNAAVQQAYVAGFGTSGALVATSSVSDFLFSGQEVRNQSTWRLVTPAGSPFTLTVRDAGSGLLLFQGAVAPGSEPNRVTPVDPPLSMDATPPAVLSVSPATVHRFVIPPIGALAATMAITQRIQAAIGPLEGQAIVTVAGAPGAAPAGATLRLSNVSARTGEPGHGESSTRTALADGSFPGFGVRGRQGDWLSFAVDNPDAPLGAPVVVRFDKLVQSSGGDSWKDRIEVRDVATGALVPGRFTPDAEVAAREVQFVPDRSFELGASYLLTVKASTADTARPPNEMTMPFVVGFGWKKPASTARQSTGFVRKVLWQGGLLIETGEDNQVRVFDASVPSAAALAAPCAVLPLPGAGRDLLVDRFQRLVVVGGGGSSGLGFLKLYDILPGTGCAGRFAPAGVAVVSDQVGGDYVSFPPPGVPRRVSLHEPVERTTFTLDRDPVPAGLSIQWDGPDHPGALTVTRQTPLPSGSSDVTHRMVRLVNLSTGEICRKRVAVGSSFALALGNASTGDTLSLEVGIGTVAVVSVAGYGFALVDLEGVHDPGSDELPRLDDPRSRRKLLLAYDGTSSAAGIPCLPSKCDAAQRCAPSGSDCTLFLQPPADYRDLGLPPLVDLISLEDSVVDPRPLADGRFNVFSSLNGYGLVSFSVDLFGRARPSLALPLIRAGHTAGVLGSVPLKPASSAPARAVAVAFAPAMSRPTEAGACATPWSDPKDLVFVAAGTNGVYVVDVSDPVDPRPVGRYETEGGALTVAVDALRKLLYVGDAGSGVKVFSVEDPCGETGEGLPNDPRLVTTFRFGDGGSDAGVSNAPVEVDPETGFSFASANLATGAAGTLHAYNLGGPPIHAVSDVDHNGQFERLSSVVPLGVDNPDKRKALAKDPDHPELYTPDSFRLLAFVPGGAGPTVTAEVVSVNEAGADLPESAPGFPKTGFKGNDAIVLKRESDDPAEEAFNRYQSDWIHVLADPRAQGKYLRSYEEVDPSNPGGCPNCGPGYPMPPPPPPPPRIEIWSGAKIRVRLTDDLTDRLGYLGQAGHEVDLARSALLLASVRGDLAPTPKQGPRLSSSEVATDAAGVDLSTGEKRLSATDLGIAGRGLDFALTRSYSSRALHDGPLGRSWDSTLFARLRELPSGDVDYFDGTGRRDTFRFDPKTGTLGAPPGLFATLVFGKDSHWYLTLRDKTVQRFDETGRLVEIRDPVTDAVAGGAVDGNQIRLFRDGTGRLVRALDTLDHLVTFEWWGDSASPSSGGIPGRLMRVTDHTGRSVEYRYDARARLTKVLLPEVKTVSIGQRFEGESGRPSVSYASEPSPGSVADLRPFLLASDNVVSVRNARNQETLSLTYADAILSGALDVVSGLSIAGKPVSIAYQGPPTSPVTATVTGRRGHVVSVEHTADGHLARVLLPTNLQTDANTTPSIALPVGPLAPGPLELRQDFGGSPDGLVRSTTLPGGQTESRTYQSGQGPWARRSAGNVTAHVLSGGSSSLTTTAEYDGATNAPRKITQPGSLVTTVGYVEGKGLPKAITPPPTWGAGVDPQGVPSSVFIESSLGYDPQDKTGQLRSFTDPAKIPHRIEYGQKGETGYGYVKKVLRLPDTPSQTARDVQSDARGNVVAVTNERGARTTYVVDEEDRVVEEHRAVTGTVDGHPPIDLRVTRAFDPDGNLVEERLTHGDVVKTSRFAYDSLGRLLSRTDNPESSIPKTTSYEYDSAGNLALFTDPEGSKTAVSHDARGLPVAVQRIPAPGRGGDPSSVTTLLRDANGNVLEEFDGVNTRTGYAYDPLGRLAAVSSPRGATSLITYDDASRPVRTETRAPAGTVLRREDTQYTPSGDVYRRTVTILDDALAVTSQAVTRTGFDEQHRPVAVEDPLGRKTLVAYDDRERKVTTTDPFGNVTVDSRDARGNRVAQSVTEKTASGTETITTSATYDALDRLVAARDPLGGITRFTRDGPGRVLESENPEGIKTGFVYDLYDRLLSRTEAKGRLDLTTSYGYNRWDLVETQTDPTEMAAADPAARKKTVYEYDGLGRLVRTTWADGRRRQATYNPDGTTYESVDERGNRTRFTYGPDDQVSQAAVTRAAGTPGFTQETFAYDPLGRLTSATTDAGLSGGLHAVTRTYDSRDLVLSESLDGQPLRHGFDLVGNRIQTTLPGRVLSRTYDARDLLSTLSTGLGPNGTPSAVATFEPWGLSRVSRSLRPAGLSAVFSYDGKRRLAGQTLARGAASPLLDLAYSYGPADQVLAELRRHDGGKADAFAYDPGYRLVAAGLSQLAATTPDLGGRNALALVLDKANAIEAFSRKLDGVASSATNQTTSRHQYTVFSDQTVSHDAAGNRASDGRRLLEYDAKNRLVKATTVDGTVVEYGYDALGRRVERRQTVRGDSTSTRFVYDGWELVQELSCATGCSQEASYVLSREYIPSQVLDRPLELIAHPATGPPEGKRLLLFGGLSGSIGLVTDDQGRPLERIRYLPQGQPVFDPPVCLRSITTSPAGNLSVELRYAFDPAAVGGGTVQLVDVATGAALPATVTPQSDGKTISISGVSLLANGRYRLVLTPSLADAWGGANGAPLTAEFVYQSGSRLHDAPEYRLGLQSQSGLTRLWQGLEWDQAVGLYYVRNRWYDPETGAFLSADPLGFPDGPNQYSWPRADWWRQDPWGLQSDEELNDRFFRDLESVPRSVAYEKDKARRELSAAQAALETRPKSVLGYLLAGAEEGGKQAWTAYRNAPARAREALRSAWTTREAPAVNPELVAVGGDYGRNAADRGYGVLGDLYGKGAELTVEAAQYGAEGKALETGLLFAGGVAASRSATQGASLSPRVRRGVGGRVESAFAKIETHHIGGGTGTTAAARRSARALGQVSDDAGHLIANRLGGPGGTGFVVPQNARVNRGAFRDFESGIAEDVLAGKEVFVRVVPRYQGNATRPYEILYQVRTDGRSTSRVFPNPP